MSQQQKQNSKVNAMLQGIPFQNTDKTEKSMTTSQQSKSQLCQGIISEY